MISNKKKSHPSNESEKSQFRQMSKNKLIPELRFPEFENDGEWDEKILWMIYADFFKR